jgi:hypothetical protein
MDSKIGPAPRLIDKFIDKGGYLIGPADWIADRVEHRAVLRGAPPAR